MDGGEPPTPLRAQRYTLGRGVKRKLSSCEDLDLPYPQQRQLVLDLCLDKLQNCQQRAEPSLHRSVLLANTLRQIQQEMRQEGETYLPPAPLGPSLHASTPRHFPDLPPVPLDCPPSLIGALSPLFPLTNASEDVQLGGPENETVLPSFAAEENARSSDSLFGSFEITNSTSYLTDLPLDDIFEDIDTSMYDSSDISVLPIPGQRSGGVDDGLKNASCCSSNGSLQLCLSDLNDLDHIMEILVRS
ncbi:SERTA domain-containing protein 2 isoform X2 [Triplophysa dalaica]|uniref:SERTA domain-containing protein 2 isoform X2 n=1 Tax=Triplophysa dalaica TaxID=1582913 RepID=UPI0024E04104|nr:SERTA domain-containing protein 2 isoform X2 [Triplophysa dalaica]XP_056620399.1 SERTA domain-containing protein 2 isoform X2 [Triplophysa dalaica]